MSISFTRVLKASDLPSGSKKAVDVGGKCVLVCHFKDQLYAVSNICSHAMKPLENGKMSQGWIACPEHGARFELATGKAINPPARKPIETFPVRVVDEWIEVSA